ncbi:hat family dimerization domaincontaining protein-related [Holotrichia oblita]|uniref:Hat family dimerization domaincontaining protein-related n=1 Tax=Holotrichia oblita TaxID=644536 RepID=A0ACB9T441_HOLOL|nr:hat family dimerization domaincontaining protein-related [Holotrichia oblita]
MDSLSTPLINKKKFAGFNDKWTNDPSFKDWIEKKKDFTAMCKACNSEIAIQYEGRRALTVHANSIKHKKMDLAKKTSQSMNNFLIKKHTSQERSIIISELVFVYHNVKHGLSYNSLDCLAKNISKLIPDSQITAKMTCKRTKAAAITRNVLGPYSQEKVISDLKPCFYFSIASDASNVGNLKTFPYAVQYFNCNKGICRKLLDFYEEAEETSLDINALKKYY